ncbi:hypothetical protein [Lactobacillus mulieris]|uniref:Uncharacterized protein n=1 Tax=Lactobacillus mulieris TaxID=2508708 RepID=A0ABT4JZY5_9LACO|nr:hypothetical protein [Lactobacillus mulieris]MCZ3621298.1 hypothetical protein [Lactobacillus mulieris]MCZ3623426.1 hypothetical protein [Lactobacillus mulieris]MCZ3635306.1 hypothetical protein [Lactobacillus mulieris]
MKLILLFNQQKNYGQIPVVDQAGQTQFFIQGKLHNSNHTLFLTDINHNEIGRLYQDGRSILTSYTIDIIDYDLAQVKQVTNVEFPMFLTKKNYLITGSTKKGSYEFRSTFKKIASCENMIIDSGLALVCDIKKYQDIPYILLIAGLFSQWSATPLELPQFKFNNQLSTDWN